MFFFYFFISCGGFFFARGFVCILKILMFLCFRFFWGVLFFSKVFVLVEFFKKEKFNFFFKVFVFSKKKKEVRFFFQRVLVCVNVK